jgi:hypothetical protein
MTLNENHGIKVAPMKKFLDWLKSISAKVSFNYVFVVPSKIESKYRNQTLRKKDITFLKSPAKDLASIPQFVASLEAFAIRSNSRCYRNFNDLNKSSHYQQHLQLMYTHPHTVYHLLPARWSHGKSKKSKKKNKKKFL